MYQVTNYINGKECSESNESIAIINPSYGTDIGTVLYATKDSANNAINAAAKRFETWSKTGLSYRAELILVNNGSADGTQKEIEKIIKNNKKNNIDVVILNLKKNQGYGGGIAEGLKIAKGDYIGWAHADLQTPLIDFFELFNLIKNHYRIFSFKSI